MHITGPGGFAADSSEAFAGIDGKLLYSAVAVVVVILLLTYRSPLLWALPVFSAVVSLFVAQAVDLPPRDQGRPDRQRAERRHPHRAGVRRRDGLRPAAGRALPGGAAPPRGPARGDGVRAAPFRPGDRGQRLDGDRRHAVPAVREHELHPGPRAGRGRRHRRRPARDADPAAGPAGDLRPLVLLAGPSDVRLAGPHRDRRLGAGRPADRPRSPADLGGDRRWCWPSPRSGCSSSTPTACRTRTRSTAPPTRWSARRCSRGTSPPGPGSRSW